MFHAVMGSSSHCVGIASWIAVCLLRNSPSAPESMRAFFSTFLSPCIVIGINSDALFGIAVITGETCTLGSDSVDLYRLLKNPPSPAHRRPVHVPPEIVLRVGL